ncbi:MAG: ABC transporter permease [Oscillospiraceae bacterium]|jgi:ABC-type lipoprotein release transport system permease subunit|nr:ABC transporter permease [Oscillospiraceae bacterium]
MRTLDIIRTCFRNLTKRKISTLLTVSGVLIGTSAVIVMLSLRVGMNIQITNMLSEWADLTLIEINTWWWHGDDSDIVPPDLTDEIVRSFKDIRYVQSATPFYANIWSGEQLAVYTADGWVLQWSQFVGVYMDELENFGYRLQEGRFKQPGDPPATVLFGPYTGSNVYNFLDDEYAWAERDWNTWEYISMPIEDFMSEELFIIPLSRVLNEWGWYETDYSVIGSVTAPNMDFNTELSLVGIIEPTANDWTAQEGIFIDINFLVSMIEAFNEVNSDFQMPEFSGTYDNVRVRVDDMNNVAAVEEEIKAMGYNTWSWNQAREQMMQQIGTIQMLLAAVAAVSLLVATMNITNTMIMAIIERTKEIGIMKVLGCDIGKIRLMFLGEAALIGFLGGAAGVIFSYGLSFIINTFFGQALMGMFMYSDGEEKINISIIPPYLVLLGLGGATLIGMLAGLYPAQRSIKISALSAIAHE